MASIAQTAAHPQTPAPHARESSSRKYQTHPISAGGNAAETAEISATATHTQATRAENPPSKDAGATDSNAHPHDPDQQTAPPRTIAKPSPDPIFPDAHSQDCSA